MKLCTLLAVASLFWLPIVVMASTNPQLMPDPYAPYYGDYVIGPGHMIGIARFDNEGERFILFSDYQSGIVRRLFPVSESEFVMGPGFAVASPAEMTVRFVRGAEGSISGVSLLPTRSAASFGKRVPLASEEVTISDGKVRLAGTLMLPRTGGPHPAIILLHGSSPLTRYSFGPYPHFFASLGYAVLIYDKRGTGASTGTLVDAHTSAINSLSATLAKLPADARREYYPEGLANDALTAFRFLRSRKDINPKEVGFWGSSEGGMLATQVAARNHNVAFAINFAGFEGPLWETFLYQDEAQMRSFGVPPAMIDKAVAYLKLWIQVARTGKGYEHFLKEREEIRGLGKPWAIFAGDKVPSIDQMRWDWSHILSFNSLPALKEMRCPFLGMWGALDQETDAHAAERNARAELAESGNRDATLKIVPNASHSMAKMPSGSRMAPGVFETLRSWLISHVQAASPSGTS